MAALNCGLLLVPHKRAQAAASQCHRQPGGAGRPDVTLLEVQHRQPREPGSCRNQRGGGAARRAESGQPFVADTAVVPEVELLEAAAARRHARQGRA